MVLEAGKLTAGVAVGGQAGGPEASSLSSSKKSFDVVSGRGVILRTMGSLGHTSSQWRGGVCNPGLGPVTGLWMVMVQKGLTDPLMGGGGPGRLADPVYG